MIIIVHTTEIAIQYLTIVYTYQIWLFIHLFSRKLELPEAAEAFAQEKDFELRGFAFDARVEDVRAPRIVRVGAIQNRIVAPTTAPIPFQV